MFVTEIVQKLNKDELILLAQKKGISIAPGSEKSTILSLLEEAVPLKKKPTEHPLPSDAIKKTKIVLLPKNPLWGFAYWEKDAEELMAVCALLGLSRQAIQQKIRIFNLPKSTDNESLCSFFFDEVVSSQTESKYIRLGIPGSTFFLEFGVFAPETTQFFPLCRSNRLVAPDDPALDKRKEKRVIPCTNQQGFR
ncbi:MAG: DUF4912 domain-containing protein [Nitrospinota bacterium]